MGRVFIFLAFGILLCLTSVAAAVPVSLSHQGRILGSDTAPLGGSAELTFTLYADPDGSSSVWTKTMVVAFDDGYYFVMLDSGTPSLSAEILDGSQLYLGVSVDDIPEFTPLMPIVSVPYAITAGTVIGEVRNQDGTLVVNPSGQWVGPDIDRLDFGILAGYLSDNHYTTADGGTVGNLVKFTGTDTLGDSVVFDDGSGVGIGMTTPNEMLTVDGRISLSQQSEIPSAEEGYLKLYARGNSGSELYYMNSEGEEFRVLVESIVSCQDMDCNDDNFCTEDSCSQGSCINDLVTPCCGNGDVEDGEQCDDGNRDSGDECQENCTLPTTTPTIDGFSGTLGPDLSSSGFSQCAGTDQQSTMGNTWYTLCEGYETIIFACSVDANETAEFVSQPFPMEGVVLRDTTCDNWTGAANSVFGNDHILSVDESDPNCGNFSVSYDMYFHFGTQWGCAGTHNTNNSGGRMWAYVLNSSTCTENSECGDDNQCTADTCEQGVCTYNDITPCCGNNVQEGDEECDDGNNVSGDGCEDDCTQPTGERTISGFNGTLGPDLSSSGFSQCAGTNQVGTLGNTWYTLCEGHSQIKFACSVDNNQTAEFISPAFSLSGVVLRDTTCDDWTGGANSVYGSDHILSVDASDPNCGNYSVGYDMYVHFGGQWGCAQTHNTHNSGGHMWAYVQ